MIELSWSTFLGGLVLAVLGWGGLQVSRRFSDWRNKKDTDGEG